MGLGADGKRIIRHLPLNLTTLLLSVSSVEIARNVNAQNHKEECNSGLSPWCTVWKQLGKRELAGISTCRLDSTGNFEKYSSFTLRVKPDKTFGEEWESLVQGSACILPCPDSQMFLWAPLPTGQESVSKFSTCRKQMENFFSKCYLFILITFYSLRLSQNIFQSYSHLPPVIPKSILITLTHQTLSSLLKIFFFKPITSNQLSDSENSSASLEISGPPPHLETGMLSGPVVNGMYMLYPSLQTCKDLKGRRYRNTKARSRGWLHGNIVFCIDQGRCAYELTRTVTVCTKPVQAQARYLSQLCVYVPICVHVITCTMVCLWGPEEDS